MQRKYLLFRFRLLALYPVAIVAIAYFRWLAPLFGAKHVKRMRHGIPQRLSQATLRLNGVRLNVQGMDHLKSGNQHARVLLTNHNSRLDGYILLAILPSSYKSFWSNTAHISTEGFKTVAFFGRVFDLFFVHDKSNIRATFREFRSAERLLRAGGTVSFFPEGQFSQDGWVRDLGDSCIALAVKTGAQIVPIVMLDTEATFESRNTSAWMKPQAARVVVLPPISTQGRTKFDVPLLVGQIESQMNRTLAAARNVRCPLDVEVRACEETGALMQIHASAGAPTEGALTSS